MIITKMVAWLMKYLSILSKKIAEKYPNKQPPIESLKKFYKRFSNEKKPSLIHSKKTQKKTVVMPSER